MIRQPQRTTRTDTLVPYRTRVRSPGREGGGRSSGDEGEGEGEGQGQGQGQAGRGERPVGSGEVGGGRGRVVGPGPHRGERPVSAGVEEDRKRTRLNSSHSCATRMPSFA